jgi:hypothetical protein
MPHVILLDAGWKDLTGPFGSIEFVKGRSVENLSKMEAARLGAICPIETDEGINPSAAQEMITLRSQDAVVKPQTELLVRSPAKEKPAEIVIPAASVAASITREQLEAVADKSGITGLREVAADYDVKGTSISGIIDKVLDSSKG